MFDFFEFGFKLLSFESILAAVPAGMLAQSVDDTPDIFRRVNLLPEGVQNEVIKDVHTIGYRFAGRIALAQSA
ncbi:MAG: hypothetical protein P4L91_10825 [Burkholderiaceae bacterium]|nr:hypothetical protein [Burkholderiaceae bacterium]